jgi:leader peptidase (prepilin peptidase) / N-methyltransferase
MENVAAETQRPDVGRIVTIALAAFLSLLAAIRYGFQAETVVQIFVICVLVVISRHDIERHIIPNRIVVPAWITVLVAHLALHPSHWLEWIVASFGAGLFFLVFALAKPGGLGMGDVKLALLLGAMLGWLVPVALLVGLLAALVPSIVLLAEHGPHARKMRIPLAPFLALGGVVALFAGHDLVDAYRSL